MRRDYQEIYNDYESIIPILKDITRDLQVELENRLGNEKHVDRVICRCKAVDSFMKKAEKQNSDGQYKYDVPVKEIQDKIGARIVVFYKSDVDPIYKIIKSYFKRVEEMLIIPDDVSKFGYEGFHMICMIPNTIHQPKNNYLVGDFFELQIKTLYQHAWSQSNHGLGYKPGQKLSKNEERLLAFIAAQSWGADKGLLELTEKSDEV